MILELTQEVSSRLQYDRHGWLTTVSRSGQPVPRLVWFYFDGECLTVYSMPDAAKVAHIKAHPRVSMNLDTNGNGEGEVAIGGEARIDAVNADPLADVDYQAKYAEYAAEMGMSKEFLAAVNTRLKISIERVWGTPVGP